MIGDHAVLSRVLRCVLQSLLKLSWAESMVYKSVLVLSIWSIHQAYTSSAAVLLHIVLSCRGATVLQPTPGAAASILALDHQGLPMDAQPPTGDPSQGFLGARGASPT